MSKPDKSNAPQNLSDAISSLGAAARAVSSANEYLLNLNVAKSVLRTALIAIDKSDKATATQCIHEVLALLEGPK